MTIRPRPALPSLFAGRLRAAGLLAASLAVLAAAPALAETLRCRSVNGNVTCSGSGAFSCQTVNGRTTCIGGDGAVVQQFGQTSRPTPAPPPEDEAEEPDLPPAEALPMPFHGRRPLRLERRGPGGHWLHLERDGSRLRLRTDRLAVDLD